MLDVPEVEVDPLVPGERGAAVDLRPARQARLHREAAPLALRVALHLVAECRTRPDYGHLSADDVPQLRQLVDRGSPEDATHACNARIPLVDGEAGAKPL